MSHLLRVSLAFHILIWCTVSREFCMAGRRLALLLLIPRSTMRLSSLSSSSAAAAAETVSSLTRDNRDDDIASRALAPSLSLSLY